MLKNKKFVIAMIIVVGMYCLTACNSEKIEVILPNESKTAIIGNDFSTPESKKEFEEFITGKSQEAEEPKYDLDMQVADLSTIEIIGKYDKNSTSVTCKISAPDVYNYLMDNMESLMYMETEELYQNILMYIQNEKCKMRTVEIEIPVELQEDKLVLDTTSAKYQDAISGGMNSALTEIYILWYTEIKKGE